jgi:WD40 repeat protein
MKKPYNVLGNLLFLFGLAFLEAGTSITAYAAPVFCAVGWWGEFTKIDPNIGQIPPIRDDLPLYLQELAWSPNGILYAGRDCDIYTVNPNNGNTTHLLSIDFDIRGMAFSPSGTLYVTTSHTIQPTPDELRIIDLSSGNSTLIGTLTGLNQGAQGLAFSPNGTLYGICPYLVTGVSYELFTIDLSDAKEHLIGHYTSADVSQGITFTPDGSLYAIGENQFAQLNPLTGNIIGSIINLSGDFRGLAAIPEPSIFVLFCAGAISLLAYVWRLRKSAA